MGSFYRHFEMQQEINVPLMRQFIGDLCDYDRLARAMCGVAVKLHAAPLKQAPAGEYRPPDSIKTGSTWRRMAFAHCS